MPLNALQLGVWDDRHGSEMSASSPPQPSAIHPVPSTNMPQGVCIDVQAPCV